MIAFAQQLIAAANAHHFVAILIKPGRGIGSARSHRDQNTQQR
jgi:hypothetical protein